MILQKIKNSIKEVFSIIHDPNKRERGAIPILIWAIVSAAGAWWVGKSALGTAVADFLAGLIIWVAYLFQYISRFLCFTAADMFDASLTMLDKTITRDPAFLLGWSAIRDFNNMFIVLGFVIIGVATTLRIRDYEAKKLLLPLILIALLINFSGLFCGIVIDASNIVSKSLIKSGGAGAAGSGMGVTYYTMINEFVTSTLNGVEEGKDKTSNLNFLAKNIMIAFVYLVTAAVFFYMAILFIARYGILAFLFILSPLAFVCWIFPQTKKIWTSWWDHFIKWSFIGVGGSFSLWISSNLMSNMSASGKMTMESLMIILIFLVVGFKITTKSSAMGAGAVMGLATGAVGFVGGATGGIAGATGLKGLAQRSAMATKDKVTGASEKYLGKYSPVKQGTTATNKANRLAEPTKRLDNIQDNQQLAKIAEQSAITHEQAQDKAAAAQILAKRNAFGAVDPRNRDAVAKHAEAFGVSKDIFTKAAPQTLVGSTDQEAIEKVKADKAKEYETMHKQAPNVAWQSAKMYTPKPDEIRNAKASLEKRKITQNALGLSPITEKDATNKLIENEEKTFIDAGHTREESRDLAKKYIPKEHEIATMKQSLADDKIQKAIRKLAPIKAAELPTEAINDQTIGAFSENQLLEGIRKRGGADLVDKVKNYGTKGTEEYKQLKDRIMSLPKGSPKRVALIKNYLTIKKSF